MQKESISFRIRTDNRKKFEEIFTNKTEGINEAIEQFFYFRQYALQELKGKFEERELYAIVDAFNGLQLQHEHMTVVNMFVWELEDHERYNSMSKRWDINYNEFMKKVRSITSAQVYFFLLEIQRFWSLEDTAYQDENGQNSLEKFIHFFLTERNEV
ncbi:MAG: hypothetical protein ACLFPH_11120 [Bacteroidales bacterium]